MLSFLNVELMSSSSVIFLNLRCAEETTARVDMDTMLNFATGLLMNEAT